MSLLDAYSGYHQTRMLLKDEKKTSFIIEEGTFYYTSIPFGLKNNDAIYQYESIHG